MFILLLFVFNYIPFFFFFWYVCSFCYFSYFKMLDVSVNKSIPFQMSYLINCGTVEMWPSKREKKKIEWKTFASTENALATTVLWCWMLLMWLICCFTAIIFICADQCQMVAFFLNWRFTRCMFKGFSCRSKMCETLAIFNFIVEFPLN